MFDLALLGRLDLLDAEGAECRQLLKRPKLLALLAYLAAARPHGFHRRDRLVAVFWPELDQARARNALRQAVHHLRAALGPDALLTRGDDELAVNPARLRCDVVVVADLLGAGRAAEALDLVRGELLPGFHLSDAPDFERWLDHEREHWHRQVAAAAGMLARAEEEQGNLVEAARWARRVVEVVPYGEEGLRRLLGVLDRAGDRAGAVQAYDKFARQLEADLGVEPAPETRALVTAIRTRIEEHGVGSGPGSARAAATHEPVVSPTAGASSVPVASPPSRERQADDVGGRLRTRHVARLALSLVGYGLLAASLAFGGYYASTLLVVCLALVTVHARTRARRAQRSRSVLLGIRGAVLQFGLFATSFVVEGRLVAQPLNPRDDQINVFVVLSFEPSTTLPRTLAVRLWQTYVRTFSNVFSGSSFHVQPRQFTDETFGQFTLQETPEEEIVRRLRKLRPPPDLVLTSAVRYNEGPDFVRIGSFVRRVEGQRLSAPLTSAIVQEGHVDDTWHHALMAAMTFLATIERQVGVQLPDSVEQAVLRRTLDLFADGLATRTDVTEVQLALDSLVAMADAGMPITAFDVSNVLSDFIHDYDTPDDAARRRSALAKVFGR